MLADIGAHGDAIVVLRGPGARRSSLPEQIARMAVDRGMRVLRAVPDDPDVAAPYAALRRLIAPILSRVAELSPSQSRALKLALEVSPGARPEPFRVAFDVLALLGVAAAENPVVLVAGDVHRLDRETADVLCVVARWLRPTDPVVVFLSGRAAQTSVLTGDGLDQLKLGTFGAGPPWPGTGTPAQRPAPQPAAHARHAPARRRAARSFGPRG